MQQSRQEWLWILLGILVLPGLYVVHAYNYVLSHDIAEIFGIIVACAVFMFAWNARPFLANGYYLFIGVAFLFVGAIDFVHAMSFEGMFRGSRDNLSSQLWYAARYLQSVSLLAAPFFCDRKVDGKRIIAAYTVVTGLLLGTIFLWKLFPDCYVEGVGVTTFKTASDYLVSVLLLASLATLRAKRSHFAPEVYRLLVYAILASIASELAFNLYRDFYAYNNLVGHYMKIVSFFLFYKAFIETGLFRPYAILFRDLKQSEEALREARDGLESKVVERTEELRAANLRLEEELAERQRAVEMRQLVLDFLQRTESARTIREFLVLLTSFLKESFGCDATGVRYRSNGDFPYFATLGFSKEFVEAETSLCSEDRNPGGADEGGGVPFFECMCGAVIEGRVDPSLPFFTPAGTFWTNSTTELLATSREIHALATRGRCARYGYESVALIPLRVGGEMLGLMQVNDRRKGLFSPKRLGQLERIAENAAGVLGRLLVQESLGESEERFRSLVEHSSVGILIVQDGRIVFRNPIQEQIFGGIREGLPLREIGEVHPEDVERFSRFCNATDTADPTPRGTVIRFLLPGGESGNTRVHWFQCQSQSVFYRGRPALLIDMVDISRVKELEQIVTVREKLSLLGQMAAGIAHEIRNPLSGVNLNLSTVGYLCRISESMDEEEKRKVRLAVEQAQAASDKVGSVVRSIMEFSKPVPPALERIDVNEVVANAVRLADTANRSNSIEIVTSLSPGVPKRRGDPRLVEQVILNLITNAVQALETTDGPRRIEVSSSREDGGRIVLKVSDSGPGVPVMDRERIFEPLYTTRKGGHGIGLSFSHRVISEHGGSLSVGTSPLGGAEFRIDLPPEKGSPSE